MRAFTSPVTLTVPSRISLADNVFRYADESPDFVAFKKRGEDGQWADVTATEFAEQVTAVAAGLIASGITLGDRVAIMASTRYEWVLLDYAIWTVGACTVTALRAWREQKGLPQEVSVSDLELVHGLHAEIDRAVSETNKIISKAEQIKQFRILDTEWSQEAGELTPKLSLERDIVLANYASDVEAIYA